MPKLISRAAILTVAVQQARKFAQTPRGQQLIAQAKTVASDPAARQDLINRIKSKTGRGGAPTSSTSSAPYPTAGQPFAGPQSSPTAASPVTPTPTEGRPY